MNQPNFTADFRTVESSKIQVIVDPKRIEVEYRCSNCKDPVSSYIRSRLSEYFATNFSSLGSSAIISVDYRCPVCAGTITNQIYNLGQLI